MLSLKDTQSLQSEIETILLKEAAVREVPAGVYAKMQYPRWFPCFKFKVKEFFIENFGNVMMMQTKAIGEMHLLTMAFTPNKGSEVPFLLIDCMSLGRKQAVFIEYYDCTNEKKVPDALANIAGQYGHLPDYKEKEAWYIPLRTTYSIIKGNTVKEEPELVSLLLDEVRAYLRLSQAKTKFSIKNIQGLSAFRERLITEGNPSSAILMKVLGEEKAAIFYRTHFMPINEKEEG